MSMFTRFNEMRRDLIGCGCIPVPSADVESFVAYCTESGLIVSGGAIELQKDGSMVQYFYI